MAVNHHCRIKRYRLKTGTEVTVLRPQRDPEGIGRHLLDSARDYVSMGIDAYTLVVFRKNHGSSCNYNWLDTWTEHARLLPELSRERIREQMWRNAELGPPKESA